MPIVEEFRQHLSTTENQSPFSGRVSMDSNGPIAAIIPPPKEQSAGYIPKSSLIDNVSKLVPDNLVVPVKKEQTIFDGSAVRVKAKPDENIAPQDPKGSTGNKRLVQIVGAAALTPLLLGAANGCEINSDTPTTSQSPEASHTRMAKELTDQEKKNSDKKLNKYLLFLHTRMGRIYDYIDIYRQNPDLLDGHKDGLRYILKYVSGTEDEGTTTSVNVLAGTVKDLVIKVTKKEAGKKVEEVTYKIYETENRNDGWDVRIYEKHFNSRGELTADINKKWSTHTGSSYPALGNDNFDEVVNPIKGIVDATFKDR